MRKEKGRENREARETKAKYERRRKEENMTKKR